MAFPLAGIIGAWTAFWKAVPKLLEAFGAWFAAIRERRADSRLDQKIQRADSAVAAAVERARVRDAGADVGRGKQTDDKTRLSESG